MFRKTIFTGQYLDQSIPRSVNIEIMWSQYWLVNWWTGQYPILAYTTWRDLNQSQPHISIRGITKYNSAAPWRMQLSEVDIRLMQVRALWASFYCSFTQFIACKDITVYNIFRLWRKKAGKKRKASTLALKPTASRLLCSTFSKFPINFHPVTAVLSRYHVLYFIVFYCQNLYVMLYIMDTLNTVLCVCVCLLMLPLLTVYVTEWPILRWLLMCP